MVYIELIILCDLLMNYLVLLGVKLILNRKSSLKRISISSFIGLIPLIFLFTNINKGILILITLIFAALLSITSFNYKDILFSIKNIIYMYIISIFLGGSINLINIYLFPNINNYLLRVIILFILSPIITYIYIKSIKKINNNYSNYYLLDIYLKDRPKIRINAYMDTGNILVDPYKFRPIILVSKKILKIQKEKIIIVPFNTINSHGLLKCFKPEKIYIDKIGYKRDILIGLIDEVGINGADGILNRKIMEMI